MVDSWTGGGGEQKNFEHKRHQVYLVTRVQVVLADFSGKPPGEDESR